MREIVRRLSILKGARELYSLNYRDLLYDGTHKIGEDEYHITTELGATFGTQGFELLDLTSSELDVTVKFKDVAPELNELRHWHCAQFLIPVAQRFPGKDVTVIYTRSGSSIQLLFSACAKGLALAVESDQPLAVLREWLQVTKKDQ